MALKALLLSPSSCLVLLGLVIQCSTALDISRMNPFHSNTKRAGEGGYVPHSAYMYPLVPHYNPFHGYQAFHSNDDGRRGESERECKPYEPFRCPGGKDCICIQYLCDGAPDCPDGYDENPKLCTAAKRPPVEETAAFLHSLLTSHGPNYLEKLFGQKARNALEHLGGANNVAIALSESQTIDEFGHALKLEQGDISHLRSVFMAVENGDIGTLKSLGIKDSELGDVKFFLEKLLNTGFLD